MRTLLSLSSVLAGLALFMACGPAADAEATESAGSRAVTGDPGMSGANDLQDLSCWLRNATMEEALQRPSPLGETEIVLGDQVGKVCYGRPSARDRVVEGGLIPFDGPWRLGANEATVIHLPFPARVGGIDLEPGSYSIYAIPGELEWEFVLNRNFERWGIPIDDGVRSADIGSFTSMAGQMTEPVEQLTVSWHADGANEGHLVLEWETTRVEIPVSVSGA